MFTIPETAASGGAPQKPTAVVIGSGFGGLAAAIRLGARGYRVTVLERLDAPGGRAYVHRQDGFTFDAGPDHRHGAVPVRGAVGASAAGGWPTTSNCSRSTRSTRSASTTARPSTTRADPAAMRAEVARFSPGDVDGYDAFMKMSEAIYRVGFEQLGDVPFRSLLDMARIAPDLVRLQGYRSVYGLVSRYLPRRAAARGVQLPSAADRRQSVPRDLDLLPDRLSRERWGVHFADGRHRRARARPGRADRRAGRPRCASTPTSTRSSSTTARATGVALADGERIAADIVVSNADSAWTYRASAARGRAPALDRRAARARALLDGPVRLVLRHRPPLRRRRAPHDPARAALPRAAARHLRAQACSPTTSASTCTARPRPTPRSRRRAATPSTCSRRCRTLQGGTDWASAAEPYRRAHRRTARGDTCCPDLDGRSSSPRADDAAGFRGRAHAVRRRRLRPRAGADAERLVPAAQPQRRRREPLPRRRRHHPGAGLPGVLSSARILDKVVPHAAHSSERAFADAADLAACRARDPRRLAQLLRRLAAAAARGARRRPSRSTPSAASPTTRSISRAARRRAGAPARTRSTRAYAGRPLPTPADRAFADRRARASPFPRALPEALLEGFDWDARAAATRRLDDAARLCRARRRLGRRDDGAADGRARRPPRWRAPAISASRCSSPTSPATSARTRASGRLYLPLDWLREAGIDPEAWLAAPALRAGARAGRRATARRGRPALSPARAAGIAQLPLACRPGILAARAALCRDRPRGRAAQLRFGDARAPVSTPAASSRWSPAPLAARPCFRSARRSRRWPPRSFSSKRSRRTAPPSRPARPVSFEARFVRVLEIFERLERRRHRCGR